jgi:divalent metal cation (Fe/Co/Zn/Cd) transporter
MLRKAREHRSMALEADARHLFTDVWTSAGVLIGLLAVQATGWLWLDPLMAIAVAAEHRCARGYRLDPPIGPGADGPGCRARGALADRGHAAQFAHQTIRFDHVTTRRAGQRRFVDLHMHLPAGWTLGVPPRCADRWSRR